MRTSSVVLGLYVLATSALFAFSATFTNPIRDENGSDPWMVRWLFCVLFRLMTVIYRPTLTATVSSLITSLYSTLAEFRVHLADYLTTTDWTDVTITRATVSTSLSSCFGTREE